MNNTTAKLPYLICALMFLLSSGVSVAKGAAIIDAVRSADENRVKAVIAADPKSVNVLYRYDTALTEAVQAGLLNIVTILIDNGADINLSNSSGLTALDYAYMNGNWPIAKLLLRHGGKASMDGKSEPILSVVRANKLNEVKEILLSEPKQIYAKDTIGNMLHWTALLCHEEMLPLIGKQKEIVFLRDLKNDNFNTPLHLAAYSGCLPAATLLLMEGANVNATTDRGETPLHQASVYGHQGVASLLIDHGAEINAKANYGITPLHYAAMSASCNVEFVELLITKGANVNLRDEKGRTPYTAAKMWGKHKRADFLRRHGGKK